MILIDKLKSKYIFTDGRYLIVDEEKLLEDTAKRYKEYYLVHRLFAEVRITTEIKRKGPRLLAVLIFWRFHYEKENISNGYFQYNNILISLESQQQK